MNAVDTNVLIYAMDVTEPIKQPKAKGLLNRLARSPADTVVLWQAASEYLCGLRRWQAQGRLSDADVTAAISHLLSTASVVFPTNNVLWKSLDLSRHYSLSHWDSMLLAACVEAGVDTLYSEDFTDGMTYDSVTVVNPLV